MKTTSLPHRAAALLVVLTTMAVGVLLAGTRDRAARPTVGTAMGNSAHVDPAVQAKVDAMLARVAAARGLPIRRPVPARVLDRVALESRLRAHATRKVPLDRLALQGELMSGFELAPAEFDFVSSAVSFVTDHVTGFYDPDEGAMYVVTGADDRSLDETLAHELVHALQDQSFPLGPMTRLADGGGDRSAAANALIEGDATSTVIDVVGHASSRPTLDALRASMIEPATSVRPDTPHLIRAGMIASYVDGYAFVEALRARGGFAAVDASLRNPPETTQQLLHLDVFDTRKPAIPVSTPSLSAFGPGFRVGIADVMGEQALRLMLEEWTDRATASAACAGWGGGSFVVGVREAHDTSGRRTIASAIHVRMDTAEDASRLAVVLETRWGTQCVERQDLGPITWLGRDADVVMVAGPYDRVGSKAVGGAECEIAVRWASEILDAGSGHGR